MSRKLAMLLLLGAFVGFLNSPPALAQHPEIFPQTATLAARRTVDGYEETYSGA